MGSGQVTVARTELKRFQRDVLTLLGIDLSGYRESQLVRRLEGYLARNGLRSLDELASKLASDVGQRAAFRDFLTINVSEFFRDPEKYRILEDEVIPVLLEGSGSIGVWSAGCSVGAEPYSLAMLLDAHNPQARYSILATDVDSSVLQIARAGGPYSYTCIRNVPQRFLSDYLEVRRGSYWVSDRLRTKVKFKEHDLLRDPYGGPYDLIVCRNVVIYFTPEAKDRVYRGFVASLKPGGFLFVGSTEILLTPRALGLVPYRTCFYRKVSG